MVKDDGAVVLSCCSAAGEHQGAKGRSGNSEDPMYVKLLEQLLGAEGFDFIFEEAAG